MMIEHYFGVEQAIVENLKQAFSEIDIYTPFNIEAMLATSNSDLSLHVIYFDDRIADSVSTGKVNSVYQQWLVVLCVRDSQAQLEQTNSIRNIANPLILKLLQAMQGFNPHLSGFKTFKRANSPVRQGGQSCFAYFPFLFEIQMFI